MRKRANVVKEIFELMRFQNALFKELKQLEKDYLSALDEVEKDSDLIEKLEEELGLIDLIELCRTPCWRHKC